MYRGKRKDLEKVIGFIIIVFVSAFYIFKLNSVELSINNYSEIADLLSKELTFLRFLGIFNMIIVTLLFFNFRGILKIKRKEEEENELSKE